MYTPTPDIEDNVMDSLDPSVYHVALLVSLTICLVIFILLVTFAYLRYKHREDRRQRYMEESSNGGRGGVEELGMPGASTLSELIEQSSGSGSGLPLLVQRTIAKQIHMVSVGQGELKGRRNPFWHWQLLCTYAYAWNQSDTGKDSFAFALININLCQ